MLIKESLRTAYFEYLMANSYDNISIKELTELVNCSRMTFYRNYKSKEDILDFWFDELIQDLTDRCRSSESAEEYTRVLLEYAREESEYIKALFKHGYLELLFRKVNDRTRFSEMSSEQLYLTYARIGAIFNCLVNWIQEDMQTDPEVILKHISRITND